MLPSKRPRDEGAAVGAAPTSAPEAREVAAVAVEGGYPVAVKAGEEELDKAEHVERGTFLGKHPPEKGQAATGRSAPTAGETSLPKTPAERSVVSPDMPPRDDGEAAGAAPELAAPAPALEKNKPAAGEGGLEKPALAVAGKEGEGDEEEEEEEEQGGAPAAGAAGVVEEDVEGEEEGDATAARVAWETAWEKKLAHRVTYGAEPRVGDDFQASLPDLVVRKSTGEERKSPDEAPLTPVNADNTA
eukprot:g17150.t1